MPCTLTSAQASNNVEAECATLQVPENPEAPDGRYCDGWAHTNLALRMSRPG